MLHVLPSTGPETLLAVSAGDRGVPQWLVIPALIAMAGFVAWCRWNKRR